MLYKLVPPSMRTDDIQYIDGLNDAKIVMTLQDKGMTIVPTSPKKVGKGQFQIGYCRDPQFALVRVESTRLAMLERVVARSLSAARKRIPTMEEQLERLNAPQKAKKPLKPQRIFGCEIVEDGKEFVVYKNGVEVGRAKDRREAQEVARANW
jgi:hypothetical protein